MVNPAQQLLADAQIRIAELLRASPAADLERNLKALLAQTFQVGQRGSGASPGRIHPRAIHP